VIRTGWVNALARVATVARRKYLAIAILGWKNLYENWWLQRMKRWRYYRRDGKREQRMGRRTNI
jgi:hypothetical protein